MIPAAYHTSVSQDLYALHNVTNHAAYVTTMNEILAKWNKNPSLTAFAEYFKKEWIYSRFWRWSTYHTPPGYTPTNCPIESYNRDIKRVHTKNETLSVISLITLLCETMIKYESIRQKPFSWNAVPNDKTVKLATIMLGADKPFCNQPDVTYSFAASSRGYQNTHFNSQIQYCKCFYYMDKAICCHIVYLALHFKQDIFGFEPVCQFSSSKKTGRPEIGPALSKQ